ncbi:MAG: GNAT family N-acetyltransferase [Spirochaetota bacterium]
MTDQTLESQHSIRLRNLLLGDYHELKEIMDIVYPDLDGAWPRSVIASLVQRFPEAQFCIEDNGKLVAAALTVRVDYRRFIDVHTYDELVEGEQEVIHQPHGDALYGLDVFVHPDYRDFRLGRRLYDARKELCREHNYRAIIAGGRIPFYHKYSSAMTPQEYIEKVRHRDLYDPILTFQLNNDFQVQAVLEGYNPEDTRSRGNATLLEWTNIYYRRSVPELVDAKKSIVRLGLVQWQMRPTTSVDDLVQQIEFFVDAISGYRADFCVFPEFFNAPLMGLQDHRTSVDAIRYLSGFTETLRDRMSHLAVSYNVNIVAGSMPQLIDEEIYNVSFLCHRDGRIDAQYKLHITPQEYRSWVMEGGSRLHVFDTDAGRVGILICYDIEFPELGRILHERGVQILFVPFWTDTQNGYLRVRRCAQARAIEDECYVAITGSVGNLPRVDSVDVQYSQSAVFSPSDFAFPHDAIMAESTPNSEMTLIVDADLERLRELRNEGSVTNGKDRRLDLYSIDWLGE